MISMSNEIEGPQKRIAKKKPQPRKRILFTGISFEGPHMISHHPTAELQFDFSTGILTKPFALAVASHVALCDQCSIHLEELNASRRRIPDQASDSDVSATYIADGSPMTHTPCFDAQTIEVIPEPLRPYLSHNIADIPWHRVSGGMEELRLQVNTPGHRVSLVRLAPGCEFPTHTHAKEELTVVLSGGYTDGTAHFERGDLSHLDSSTTHSPVADPEVGCFALGVLSGPIELTGLMGTLLNPLLRF